MKQSNRSKIQLFTVILFLMIVVCIPGNQSFTYAMKIGAPAPTYKDISYGDHERNVLDLWLADSDSPTPLVVYIHGGGFVGGDKSKARRSPDISYCMNHGVSFAAINYRFRKHANLQDILRDSARAIQFLRFNADKYNIDKTRIAAFGGSAGAGTSMWLAFHDDLADPKNDDPVLRESTRLTAAGSINGQFSYDLLRWPEVFEGAKKFQSISDICSLYGFKNIVELKSDKGKAIRADLDMHGLITSDDPPVYVLCMNKDEKITSLGILHHHPGHSVAIKNKCDEMGVKAVLNLPLSTQTMPDMIDWLVEKLTSGKD